MPLMELIATRTTEAILNLAKCGSNRYQSKTWDHDRPEKRLLRWYENEGLELIIPAWVGGAKRYSGLHCSRVGLLYEILNSCMS